MVMSDLEPTCNLCSVSIPPRSIKEWEITWRHNCAKSLYQLLDFESVIFREFLEQADYCSKCKELVRDIDFMMRSVRCLQRRIATAKAKVSSLLLSRLSSHGSSEDSSDIPSQEVQVLEFSASSTEDETKPSIGYIRITGDIADISSVIFWDNSVPEETNQSNNSIEKEVNPKEIPSRKLRSSNRLIVKNKVSTNEDSPSSGSDEEDEDYHPDSVIPTVVSESDEEISEIEEEDIDSIVENKVPNTKKFFKETVAFLRTLEPPPDDSKYSYVCTTNECSRRFRTLYHLRRHSTQDHKERVEASSFQCPFCENNYYSNEYGLDQHIIRRHEGDTLCCICSFGSCRMRFYGIKRSVELKSHMALDHGIENYVHKKAFIHMDYRDLTVGPPVRKRSRLGMMHYIPCPVEGCGTRVMSEKTLEFHRKEVHENDPFPYNCKDCDYKGKSRQAYDKHRLSLHSTKTITCQLCPYTTHYRANYRHHMKARHKDQEFPCSVCLYVYRRKEDCLEHEKWHKRVPDFKCVKINCKNKTIFNTLEELQEHMVEAHNPIQNREVVCEICGAVFKGKNVPSVFNTHMKVHGEARYGCRFCERKFKLDHLRRCHEEINHQDVLDESERKVYSCKLCDATFHAQQYLHKHNAWHKHGSNANLPISKKKHKL